MILRSISALIGGLVSERASGDYVRKDPASYDHAWRTESTHDNSRSKNDCFCDKNPGTKDFWNGFLMRIRMGVEHESSDPFWVNGVCAKAYPYIWKMLKVDENDSFVISSDCSAGLLSMLIVCARSTSLMMEKEDTRGWVELPRVVGDEGTSVGDRLGLMDYRTCRSLCEANSDCKSIAHGPHGCHLKEKCVDETTELADARLFEDVDEENMYKTHYRKCDGDGNILKISYSERHEDAASKKVTYTTKSGYDPELSNISGRNARLNQKNSENSSEFGDSQLYKAIPKHRKGELENLMLFVVRASEFCFHCLDDSRWPFSIEEIKYNYALFLEDRQRWKWVPMKKLKTEGMHSLAEAAEEGGSVVEELRREWALDKFKIRWTRAIDSEVGFWFGRLSWDFRVNEKEDSRARLQQWLLDGSAPWAYDNICDYVETSKSRRGRTSLHILNTGSGPFSPRELKCTVSVNEKIILQPTSKVMVDRSFGDELAGSEEARGSEVGSSQDGVKKPTTDKADGKTTGRTSSGAKTQDGNERSSPKITKLDDATFCSGLASEGYSEVHADRCDKVVGEDGRVHITAKSSSGRSSSGSESGWMDKIWIALGMNHPMLKEDTSEENLDRINEESQAEKQVSTEKILELDSILNGDNLLDDSNPKSSNNKQSKVDEITADKTKSDKTKDDDKTKNDTTKADETNTIENLSSDMLSSLTVHPGEKLHLSIPITSSDGLGKYYLQLYDYYDMVPPTNLPIQCQVEELGKCFPTNYFDITHMRNALDHVFDPIIGLKQMLQVTRPGGFLLLRHAQNEGVPGEFRVGLHQWAFDVEIREEIYKPVVGFRTPQKVGRGHFIMWNPELRIDVTEYLLNKNLVTEIIADLVPHPSGNAAPHEKFVWVDIIK